MTSVDKKYAQVHLLIRTDATASIGTGHVMRCFALALAAKNAGMHVRFVCRVNVPWVRQRLISEGVECVFLEEEVPMQENPQDLLAQISGNEKQWLVLDGYHFGSDCQRAVLSAGYKLMVIDDYNHLREYCCDILLNQNIGAEIYHYEGEIGKILIGPRYALLRPEFLEARKKAEVKNVPEKVKKILLTLGGGDFSDHLVRLADDLLLPALSDCILRVVPGKILPKKIHSILNRCPAKIEVLPCVDNMPELMLWADLCITAGGSTCWELCCLGVPFLTISIAKNQYNVVSCLAERNMAPIFSCTILDQLLHDRGLLFDLCAEGMRQVRGDGADRVIRFFADAPFHLSPALPSDSERVFQLANDVDVRSTSFSPEPITKEVHECWYRERIKRTHEPFFLAFDEDIFVGYVRFEWEPSENFVVTVALQPECRGKGLGAKLVMEGMSRIFCLGAKNVYAWVRSNNLASFKTFTKAGFEYIGEKKIRNMLALHFVIHPRE